MIVFVQSGRHGKWEKKCTPSVELTTTSLPANQDATPNEEGPVVADAAVLETKKGDSVYSLIISALFIYSNTIHDHHFEKTIKQCNLHSFDTTK